MSQEGNNTTCFDSHVNLRPSVLFAGRWPDCQLLSLQPDTFSLSQNGQPLQVQAEHSRLQPVRHGLRRICHRHGYGPGYASGEHLDQASMPLYRKSWVDAYSKRDQILPGVLLSVTTF